jgi:hypothetical protein
MSGVHIAETEDSLILTLEKSHVKGNTVRQIIQYLQWQTLDISHIPQADDRENEEIAASLQLQTKEDRSIGFVETITF